MLDDFSTGYSSLSYITRFPVDIIKLDRSFVSGIGSATNDRRVALINATVALCEDLGITLVAEGIEPETELEASTKLKV